MVFCHLLGLHGKYENNIDEISSCTFDLFSTNFGQNIFYVISDQFSLCRMDLVKFGRGY